MKFAIAFAAVLAVASAQFGGFGQSRVTRPPPPPPRQSAPTISVSRVTASDKNANTLQLLNEIYPDGSYKYEFETDNGIAAQAQGTPRDFGGNPPVIADVAQGGFSWISPEGDTVAITYIADENGYQPSGNAIPTPPPIPEAILKALAYIEKHPPQKN